MRRIFIVTVILGLGVVGSCKKPVTTQPSNKALIAGKWLYTADTLTKYNSKGDILSLQALTNNYHSYQQFNADGSYIVGNDSTASHGTYTINANSITVNFPAQRMYIPGFGTLPTDAFTEVGNIISLTSTKMELYYIDKYSDSTKDVEAEYFSK